MEEQITDVEFRKVRNPYTKESEVIAIFVKENWDYEGKEFASYMHVGQHSGASKVWAKRLRFASKAEYTPLKNELENIVGYRLNVLNKAA